MNELAPHLIEVAPRISHSDLSIDMNYDEQIDAYDKTEFIEFLDNQIESLKNNLRTRKGKALPDIQVISNFFMEAKEKFSGITAMIIFDELTDRLEMTPEQMYNNVARPIRNQLRKELAKVVSLDKYKKRAKKESVDLNGAVQMSFSDRS